MVVTKFVMCKFQVEGWHCWPAAAEHSTEAYLESAHRHMFHFEVKASVMGSDREIEFISWKRELQKHAEGLIGGGTVYSLSCEHIAEALVGYLRNAYGNRVYIVEVSEDGENGAQVIHEDRRAVEDILKDIIELIDALPTCECELTQAEGELLASIEACRCEVLLDPEFEECRCKS